MVPEEVLRRYQRAGRIAAEVREEARRLVRVGMPLLEICEGVEGLITEKGGRPAFPCNVCLNEVAAHYSSPPHDEGTVPEGAVVKVDIGVHVDGYIADTAATINLNPAYEGLCLAVEEALEQALDRLRPGVKTSEIGAAVQRTIERRGFKPVRNLTGHQVGRYIIHTGKSIPSVSTFDSFRIREGDVCALEPFATLPSGLGEVHGTEETYIYRLNRARSVRDVWAMRLLDVIRSRFRTLPFSERWIRGAMPEEHLHEALSRLVAAKRVFAYPVLVEGGGTVVSQAEHTAVVTEDGCLVLTR